MYWREYRILHTDKLRNEHSGRVDHFFKQPRDVFNALQLEKLWAVVTDDHLDRERAVMTNVTQAIEFCLKAIQTHAAYRETGEFAFTEGHDLEKIYKSLPEKRCFRHQLLRPHPYLVLTKPLRLDIQCQRAASVKIGWKYLDD